LLESVVSLTNKRVFRHFRKRKRKADEFKLQLQRKIVQARGAHISKASGLSRRTAHARNIQKASGSHA